MTKTPFLIVGGGIGGLAAALALAKTGRAVHVLERAAEFTELGAGLQLSPNASRVFQRLDILDEISKRAFFPTRLVMMDMMTGEEVTSLDLGQRFRERYKFPYLLMHRGDLLSVELAACRASPLITLENNREVSKIDELASGARVACTDGSTYECGALIGADGLHSKVRNMTCNDGAPVCSRYVAYRGTAPIGDIAHRPGLDAMTIWIGPEKHFVQYPLRGGEIGNQVLVFRSHNYVDEASASDAWGGVDELEQQYAATCDYVRSAIKQIQRNRRWPMYDRPPHANWNRNAITLLGDAAHPMLQYIAQGACQALEDSVCLAEKVNDFGDNAATAFAAYRDVRFARTALVQTAARGFGEMIHTADAADRIRRETRAHGEFHFFDGLYGADA